MTNNTNNNKKIFILEWESAELKDGTMRCENFRVAVGSEKGNLLFYSTFFSGNNFKKGEIYRLVTPGNFVEDKSGNIPGSFDASGIIQGIDNGGYEFKKISPTLHIEEIWKEKKIISEKLDLSEKEVQKKKEEVDRINQELLNVRREFSDLQSKFTSLQLEKEKSKEKVSLLEKETQNKEQENSRLNQEFHNSKEKAVQLQSQLDNLKTEKTKIENERITPERHQHFLQEEKRLKNELEVERNKKQDLINQLEEIHNREWKKVIEAKLDEKKNELSQLKIAADNKLESNQKVFLEMLLVTQEQIDNLIFEGVDPKICSPMKNQLEQHKKKLNPKLNDEEVKSLCLAKTEVIKLEAQLNQWEKIELQQEYVEVPPKQ